MGKITRHQNVPASVPARGDAPDEAVSPQEPETAERVAAPSPAPAPRRQQTGETT